MIKSKLQKNYQACKGERYKKLANQSAVNDRFQNKTLRFLFKILCYIKE